MKNSTPMFLGFHLQTLRRKPRSEAQKLADNLALLQQKSIKQIGEVFDKFIPKTLLKPEKDGVMSRRRLFSKENTFSQVISHTVGESKMNDEIQWLQHPTSELVFHYTKLSTALELILHNRKIRFGDFTNTNDPYEKSINDIEFTYWGKGDKVITNADNVLRVVHKRCRLFCTTEDNKERCVGVGKYNLGRGYSIPSLWAHYAENHKGICFAFDKQKLCETAQACANSKGCKCYGGQIEYNDPPGYFTSIFDIEINGNEDINLGIINHIDLNHRKILFTKDKMWEYENEFRIAVICSDDNLFEIDISSSLVGVILGCEFPDCYNPLIINARNGYNINSAIIQWKFGMPYVGEWPPSN